MKLFVIVATPVYATLFWAIVFLTNKIKRDQAKFSLGIFMALATILYCCHALFFLKYSSLYLTIDALYLFTSLSVYPMYYLYVRLLTCDEKFQLNRLLHFIPSVLLAFALVSLQLSALPDEKNDYLNNVLINNDIHAAFGSGHSGWLARIFFISRMIFAVQVVYYLIQGYRLASAFNDRIKHYYSSLEDRQLMWVKLLSLMFLAASMASTVFNIIGRGRFLDNENLLVIPSAIFSSLLFFVGMHGNKQKNSIPEVISSYSLIEQPIVRGISHNQHKDRLMHLMRHERIYLEPDLTINQVSGKLCASNEVVASLISQEYGEDFNSFINRYRTGFACQLLKKKATNTFNLDKIAQESGFMSKSSFVTAFKVHEGISPQKYIQRIQ